jgi:hypothetical protein
VFLSEFFHPDHGDNITDVVIFGYNPPDPTVIPRLGVQPQGNVTEYIQIQPGEYSELSRSRADKANAVFILNSSAALGDPRDLDSRATLYAVLVKQYECSVIMARAGAHSEPGTSRAAAAWTCLFTCSCCSTTACTPCAPF